LPGSATVEYLSFGDGGTYYAVTYVSPSETTLWDMVSSIGPITSPIGYITGGAFNTITTSAGSLFLASANPTSVTFQATYVGNPPAPHLTRTGVLSHIAAGGGWTTVITLVNNSQASVPVTVSLYNDDGSALSLPVTITQQGTSQTTTTSSVAATINGKESFFISAGDGMPATSVGWADVDSGGTLGGYAIFRQTPQSGSPSEGTVPLQTQFPSTITLPYDDSTGFAMGVALASLSTASANVTATVWDDSGNQLGTQSLTIAGNGHMSFVLPTQIPLTVGRRGIVQFQSSGGLAGLGLRFSPFGTFTSVPTI
jgi:hypothetical protein